MTSKPPETDYTVAPSGDVTIHGADFENYAVDIHIAAATIARMAEESRVAETSLCDHPRLRGMA